MKLGCFISLASVQIFIQIVPLCNYDNNIRKQVYMAFEHGQQVSKDKFILQRDPFFNLTRIFERSTHKCSVHSIPLEFVCFGYLFGLFQFNTVNLTKCSLVCLFLKIL